MKETKAFIKKMIEGDLVWLICICLLVFFIRLYYGANLVLDPDESDIFVVVQDLVKGGIPYKTAFFHKGPVLFFILAPIIKIFGDSILALRIFTSLYLCLSMIAVYFLGRRLFRNKLSLLAPLLYGMFFSGKEMGGLASNGELFMMLPLILATLSFLVYLQGSRQKSLCLFLCGFFSAASILVKSTAAFTFLAFIPFFGLVMIKKRADLKRALKEILVFLAGCLCVSAPVFIYLSAKDAFGDFVSAYFVFNMKYVASIPFPDSLKNFVDFINLNLSINLSVITFCGIASALYLLLARKSMEERRIETDFMLTIALFSLLGVVSARNMYSHYFLQMGLAFSVLIPLAVWHLQISEKALQKAVLSVMFVVLYLVVLLPSLYGGLVKRSYIGMQNDMHYAVAGYIKSNTSEDDRIFVLGGQPIIYFLSERKAPTKHFYWLSHYGRWEKALGIRDHTLAEFEKSKPRYFIYMDKVFTVGRGDLADLKNHYLHKFMLDNYFLKVKIGDYMIYEIKKAQKK